jgi:hypothetical protein
MLARLLCLILGHDWQRRLEFWDVCQRCGRVHARALEA